MSHRKRNTNIKRNRVLKFEYNSNTITIVHKGNRKIDVYNNNDFLYCNINEYRLSFGNSKLYKIMIFDLPAIKEICGRECPSCYAKKAQRMYKNVAKFREINYILFKHAKPALKYLICNQLTKYIGKYNTVRIHSSGDFFSQEYIDFWYNIMRAFPMYKFYAYTKRYDDFDFETNKPNNFNIINSIIEIDGKKYINYGPPDYIKMLISKDPTLFICPATTPNTKNIVKCGLNCKYCVDNDKVVFYIH